MSNTTARMIKINLLPAEVKVQIPKAYKHMALGALVILLGCGAVGYVWSETNARLAEKRAEAAKKEEISRQLDIVIKEVARFKKTKADLEEKLDTIQRLKDNQRGPLRLLKELRDRLPKQVWISSVTYRKNVVTMRGFGLTLTTVGELVENLKACKFFGEINYQKSNAITNKGLKYYNFDISFPFDPDPEKTKAEAEKKRKAEEERKKAREARKKAQAAKKPGAPPK